MISSVPAVLCFSLFFAAGCSNQSGLAPAPQAVTVNIAAPASTIMDAGSTVSLTASVSTGSVTWEVYGNNCFGTSVGCGTFSSTTGNTVQYTAPASNPGNSTQLVEVRATSTANFTIFATLDFTVTPISVTIAAPSSTTLKPGTSVNLVSTTTTVNSLGNTVIDPAGVKWSFSGAGCSGATCGTLTNVTTTSVTYTAPASASSTGVSVTVTATSVSDPGESFSVTFTLPPAVIITITPPSGTTVADGDSLLFSATTTNDPTNSGVTWPTTLSCTIGGTATTGSSCGALSSVTPNSVVYTAPKVPAGTLIVSLVATSNYTPSISTTETINVPPAPVIAITPPTSTTVNDNTSLTLNATVTNDINNAGITWTFSCTISGTPTTGSACGTLSGATNAATGAPTASSVTYNAPAAPPAAVAITITATSNANNLVVVTQNLTVPSAPVITIVSPANNASVSAGASQLVTASVTNDSAGKGVTFTLTCNTGNGVVTSGSACGTVTNATNTAVTSTTTTSTFTYNAPTAAPVNPIDVTVTATSNLLSTSKTTLALVVPGSNPVTVSVSPNSATVADGATQSFTATVGNDSTNAGVTWSLSCLVGTTTTITTGSTCGALSTTSSTTAPYATIYTAPAYPQFALSVMVVATSNAASTVMSSATLSVAAAPALTIAITPQPTSPNTVYYAQSGVPLSLTAVVSNDQTTPGVTWSVAAATGFSCPSSGCGTFSAPVTTASTTVTGQTTTTDTYTPPSGLAAPLTVILTATSNSETNVTATLNVTTEAAITFSPSVLGYSYAQTLGTGQTAAYSQTISVTGGTPPYTSITATNLPTWATVTAPVVNLTAGTITISGTPSKSPIFTAITGGSYATPTILQTGTVAVTLSATDSTPNQALTGTTSAPLTTYNPNEGASTVAPSNALMTGSYALYGTGFQDQATAVAGYPLRIGIVGSLTADGAGNITGEVDVNNSAGVASYKVTGSYNVEPNQLATITILLPTTPVTPVTLVAALGGLNASKIATTGQFIEYDDLAGTSGNRVSGEMALQSTTVMNQTSSPVSGSYAFGMQGGNPGVSLTATCEAAGTESCGPAAAAGQLTFTSGAITGSEDVAYGAVSAPQVSITGSLDSSGATDTSGRMTGTLTAGNTTLLDWPTHYAIYPITASSFYFMSIDSFKTTTILAGKALQQNLPDIAATPLSGPMIIFGSVYANQAIISPSTESGGIGMVLDLSATPSSATAGTIAGTITGNAGSVNGYTTGTTTALTKYTAITGINYSVTSASGRVALSGGTFTPTTNYLGSPVLYLVDTNTGFLVTTPSPSSTVTPTGLLFFYPQTNVSSGLSAGNYTVSIFKNDAPTGTTQVAVINVPSAVTVGASTAVTITGQGFASYNKLNAEANAATTGLFDLNIAGTSSLKVTTGGIIVQSIQPGGFEACNSGPGFTISTTSYVCIPSGNGPTQQVWYATQ